MTAPHAVSTALWLPPAAASTTRHVAPHEHGAFTHPPRPGKGGAGGSEASRSPALRLSGGGGWVTARAAGPPQDARMDLRLRLFLRAVAVSVAAAKSRGSAPSRGKTEDASRAEASNSLGAALTAASAIHHDR